MTTALTQGLERIPDQLGYLVISDGAVLASSGDLENDEQTAAILSELVATACGLRLQRGHDPPFKRLSEALRGEAAEPRPGAHCCLRCVPAVTKRGDGPPHPHCPQGPWGGADTNSPSLLAPGPCNDTHSCPCHLEGLGDWSSTSLPSPRPHGVPCVPWGPAASPPTHAVPLLRQ
ncbi:ragulator complex protein LAMTOR4 isoform X1 [Mycteria americana]|uniref:ragulator complex protein LAMTOR4 isoform X1 n=1 Tax=Mycteria americana TaxID=33587 RepID=UPI003F58587A